MTKQERPQTVSWIHIGDTHITHVGEQSEIDLGSIVDEINILSAQGGIDFVFIPGDIADDGSVDGYRAVRAHLDRLQLPWFAIVGDHDVHERSFENFKRHISPDIYGGFTFGRYRFLRLNAFSEPKPDSFTVSGEQLEWLEGELKQCEAEGTSAVLLLHCYPSDLKQGGARLSELIRRYPVLLVDMGHTHYNELSNDGNAIYSATRSTGQIEEGPVGYSLTTLDEGVVSWHFVRLRNTRLVSITYPADERLVTTRTGQERSETTVPVRAKIWSDHAISEAHVSCGGRVEPLQHLKDVVWSGTADVSENPEADQKIVVVAQDVLGRRFESAIQYRAKANDKKHYRAVDQDNAIGAWEERDILGTQLGPNKNGRKW